jgi:UDP-N-acetylglucosamine 4,6-dehydratase/5-epimerase
MSGFDGKTVLITGGTGSFGRAFLDRLLKRHKPHKVIIFSRDELKQHDLSKLYPDGPYPVRYFLGDVRNLDRLHLAFREVDIVVHAAALKHVPACEYNPFEAVRTNVIGAQNVVQAALSTGVAKVVALSTDKACNPSTLYGATKLCAEKIFNHANSYSSTKTFSVVRYGNVIGSRGSVVPVWREQMAKGDPVTITDLGMTRFLITMNQAIDLVELAIEHGDGGEVFVPKLPSVNILDLKEAVAPGHRFVVTGIRQAEKMHEAMIGPDEACFDCGSHYKLAPGGATGFNYTSEYSRTVLDIPGIRELIGA